MAKEKSLGQSIIIPVHNGARHLARSVGQITGHLRKNGLPPYQIVIAEDGSSDGSGAIAMRLAAKSKNILAISRKGRLGKGRAITNALAHCKYEKVIFTDVDLSAGIEGMGEISKRLDSADLVIGSRYLKGSTCARSFSRTLLSMGYKFCVALLFLKSHSDYQCGFKGFRKSSMYGIIRSIQADSWFWDTEIILEADALGKRIEEMPVRWHEEKITSLKVGSTTLDLMLSLLRYRFFGTSCRTGGRA